MSTTDPTRHPRIHCAACQKVLVIDPALLEGPMVCTECGAGIPVEAYSNLTKIRADLAERRRLAEEAQEAIQRAERERLELEERERQAAFEAGRARVAAERQREREQRQLAKAVASAQKTARKRADAIQAVREYRANLKFSEEGSAVVSAFLVILGLLLVVVGAGIFFAAQSAIHEIEAGVAFIVAAVFLVGGILSRYVAFAAHVIIAKLELIHEAIRPHAPDARQASSLTPPDSSPALGEDGTGTPAQS